ncbi:MAG: hypothetical protein EZS26_000134 [Candidatus Ordinivivax streblomastigis]|uniref:Uncharacterized protein n=1 Tax=Candidatus Ordinivivax streblomastigis TaxID=2540710 RepID=A0A5M8P533_9BACT|nr:MAG: hypothetical protein EZS26_000134 [Candidatus Ordinivivax streblomastigis]
MNKKLGIISSLITLVAVTFFALAMILKNPFPSYFICIFIALGFIIMISSFVSFMKKENIAAGISAIIFASLYGILCIIVYFTQLTTVRLSNLTGQAMMLLTFSQFNLFFNYDILGYGFMALSTFFIGITIEIKTIGDKWLKNLLMIHGIFAISCFVLPMLNLFNADMKNGDIIGTIVLEIWCIYFIPICILSYKHFRNIKETNV